MAWRFVKQPCGLLARFSDVVDDFTHYDLTEADAADVCPAGMTPGEVREKVARGVRDEAIPPFFGPSGRGDGLDRYRDCLLTVYRVHGLGACRERHRLLGSDMQDRFHRPRGWGRIET